MEHKALTFYFSLIVAPLIHAETCILNYGSNEGTVRSPNFPNHYSANQRCLYLIAVPEGDTIFLSFTIFELEAGENCKNDYIEIYDGDDVSSPSLGKFCGSAVADLVTSSGNKLVIKFHSNAANEYKGFSADFRKGPCEINISQEEGTITSPNFPNHYTANRRCLYYITVQEGYTVAITFEEFELENEDYCQNDYLKIYDGDVSRNLSLGTFCGSAIPGPIQSSGNKVTMEFHSDNSDQYRGFSANFKGTCNVNLSSDEGTLSSMNFPFNYQANLQCFYNISVPEGRTVLLIFDVFQLESSENCKYDYIKIYDGDDVSSPTFGTFCGNTIPGPIISSWNKVYIEFVSDRSNQYGGFSARFKKGSCSVKFTSEEGTVSSPNYPNYYSANQRCLYSITVPEGGTVLLNFTSFELQSQENCENDYIEIYDGLVEISPSLGKFCGSFIHGPIPSSGNKITIDFRSDGADHYRGFSANFKRGPCKAFFVAEEGTLASPNFPNNYSANRRCLYHITVTEGYFVHIIFEFFQLELEEYCQNDYIKVYDGDDERSKSLGTYCGSTTPEAIISSGNKATIEFRSDTSDQYGGFSAKFKRTCDVNLTAVEGTLYSPNFPHTYNPNQRCVYRLSVPEGNPIFLYFDSFELETGEDCKHDHVKIHDDDDISSPILGTFCGKTIPGPVISSGNKLTVEFVSDRSQEYKGFSARFSEGSCSLKLTSAEGTLSSPNYPNFYSANQRCIYSITVPDGDTVLLDFTRFELQNQENCEFDCIEIYDGPVESSPSLGKFCGSVIYGPIPSSGNKITIDFRSDGADQYSGFSADFKTGPCEANVVSDEGNIASPNFPNNYSANRRCLYHITVKEGYVIQITFEAFELESEDDCQNDYVKIYDGGDARSLSLGTYCGSTMPGPILSSGNKATIEFRSDSSDQYVGFSAKFKGTCDVHLTAVEGTLNSQNFPYNYNANEQCIYSISVPEGNTVVLYFDTFELEGGGHCQHDYIKIYDGGDVSSPTFGAFCGTTIPGPVISSGNKITVEFVSDRSQEYKGFSARFIEGPCEANFVSEEGIIASPNFPNNYSANRKCIYHITVREGKGVQITFETFELELEDHCQNDYIKIYDGDSVNSRNLGTFCGSSTPGAVKTSGKKATVEFHSDSSGQYKGFYAKFKATCDVNISAEEGTLYSPNFPNNYGSNQKCIYSIVAPEGNSINLYFDTFQLESGEHCQHDYIKIYDGGDVSSPSLGTFCGTSIRSPIFSSGNKLTIDFVADSSGEYKGFSARFNKGSCNVNLGMEEGILSSPNFPNTYNANTHCLYNISVQEAKTVVLSFEFFELQSEENCQHDYVKIYDDGDTNTPSLGTFCGSTIPGPIQSSGNKVVIEFQSDSLDEYKGFSATFKSTCGRSLVSEEGIVHSPYYPNVYNANQKCIYSITVPEGDGVLLTFDDFQLEYNEDCRYDYVKIYDGADENSPRLGKFCGTNIPGNIMSSGNKLTVHFVSDGSNNYRGFSAKFKKGPCRVNFVSHEGIVSSPNFPNYYSANQRCLYSIAVPESNTVFLNFTSFELESEDDCNHDYIEIFDGGDETSPSLGRFCSSVIPGVIPSSGNKLTIEFRSNGVDQYNGFSANFRTGPCEVTFVSEKGTLASPNFPNHYSANRECLYRITVKKSDVVQIVFETFELEYEENCENDYIKVYDGPHVSSHSLGTFCGSTVPGPIESTGNEVIVDFHSDSSNQYKGFSAKYQGTCGRNLVADEGIIKSPNYPDNYEADQLCIYTVTVLKGNIVVLTFEYFQLESNEDCKYDYIKIYDGGDETNPSFGSFCGDTIPGPIITSSGNKLTIKFRSDRSNQYKGFFAKFMKAVVPH